MGRPSVTLNVKMLHGRADRSVRVPQNAPGAALRCLPLSLPAVP